MHIYKKITGFNMIELLVVMIITGVLMVIAIPEYRTYTITTRVSEAITYADFLKNQLATFYINHGGMQNIAQPVAVNKNNIQSYQFISSNTNIAYILVRLNAGIFPGQSAEGTEYIIIKADASGNGPIIFTCGYNPATGLQIPPRYLPNNCKNEITPE